MKKIIATIVLKLMGWKIQMDGDVKNLDRCILAVAPHTANIEYILGNLAYWKLGKPLRVIIKDAHTKAWYGFIIKAMGGIGIDRSQKNNLVQFVADLFKKEDFSLVITLLCMFIVIFLWCVVYFVLIVMLLFNMADYYIILI